MLLFETFFFQAEDGIRALYVTGVQTCALPISAARGFSGTAHSVVRLSFLADRIPVRKSGILPVQREFDRSEERRVGKECRGRWWGEREEKQEGEEGQPGRAVSEAAAAAHAVVH